MLSIQSAQDFERARRWIRVEYAVQRLTGHPHELLSFDAVKQLLGLHIAVDRGLQEIELAKIIGTTTKQRDFTRTFRPRTKTSHDRERWRRVDELFYTRGFAPIEVYQVGGVYFVHDGHHRISVARTHGMPTVEAHVLEYSTTVAIELSDSVGRLHARLHVVGADHACGMKRTPRKTCHI